MNKHLLCHSQICRKYLYYKSIQSILFEALSVSFFWYAPYCSIYATCMTLFLSVSCICICIRNTQYILFWSGESETYAADRRIQGTDDMQEVRVALPDYIHPLSSIDTLQCHKQSDNMSTGFILFSPDLCCWAN